MFSRVLLVSLAVIAALAGYALYNAIEFYEVERDLGWRAKARKNPYLALQLFAEKNGHSVDVFDSIQKVDAFDNYDFIYMTDSQLVLSEQRFDILQEWLQNGGHLMVGATSADSEYGDTLLEYLDVEILYSDFENDFGFDELFEGSQHSASNDENAADQSGSGGASEQDERSPEEIAEEVGKRLRDYNKKIKEQSDSGVDAPVLGAHDNIAMREDAVAGQTLTRLRFGDDEYDVSVKLNPEFDLFHPAMSDEDWQSDNGELIYWTGTEYGDHFIQIELGDGLVSVITDSDVFNSHDIGLFDHAHLWRMLSGDKSAVIYGSNMPSLWKILWRLIPELMLILLLALALKIWQVYGYFGPKRGGKSLSRRSFSEHLSASAGFLWRNGHQAHLLKAMRAEILSRYSLKTLGFDQLSDEEQSRWLAKECHLPDTLVFEALFSPKSFSDDGFMRCVQTLQKLRGRL